MMLRLDNSNSYKELTSKRVESCRPTVQLLPNTTPQNNPTCPFTKGSTSMSSRFPWKLWEFNQVIFSSTENYHARFSSCPLRQTQIWYKQRQLQRSCLHQPWTWLFDFTLPWPFPAVAPTLKQVLSASKISSISKHWFLLCYMEFNTN